MNSRRTFRPASAIAFVILSLAAGLAPSVVHGQAAAPVITEAPTAQTVYTGQNATFTVQATGEPAPTFQWQRETTAISGETASTLSFTNVPSAQTGRYAVRVSNASGAVTSDYVQLSVLPTPFPLLIPEPVIEAVDGNSLTLPLSYTASGRELVVEFSIQFDPNVLTQPEYLTDCSADEEPADEEIGATGGINPRGVAMPAEVEILTGTLLIEENREEIDGGRLGIRLRRQGDVPFETGPQCLGRIVFARIAEMNILDARLGIFTNPVPTRISLTNETTADLSYLPVPPVLRIVDAIAQLELQTGLMLQRIQAGNIGPTSLVAARVLVENLPIDSLGNPIRVYNATVLAGTVPALVAFDLEPGEMRGLTVEYYVSDLVTQPNPTFISDSVSTGLTPITNRGQLNVTRTQFITNDAHPNGAFLVEFPTREGQRYIIQYAPTLEGLDNPEVFRSALPAIVGNGSQVQWIDGGPPKTHTAPDGTRFYRILEFR